MCALWGHCQNLVPGCSLRSFLRLSKIVQDPSELLREPSRALPLSTSEHSYPSLEPRVALVVVWDLCCHPIGGEVQKSLYPVKWQRHLSAVVALVLASWDRLCSTSTSRWLSSHCSARTKVQLWLCTVAVQVFDGSLVQWEAQHRNEFSTFQCCLT